MALPFDIERAIQIIDQRINILQQLRRMILIEFSDEKNDWQQPFQLVDLERIKEEKTETL